MTIGLINVSPDDVYAVTQVICGAFLPATGYPTGGKARDCQMDNLRYVMCKICEPDCWHCIAWLAAEAQPRIMTTPRNTGPGIPARRIDERAYERALRQSYVDPMRAVMH